MFYKDFFRKKTMFFNMMGLLRKMDIRSSLKGDRSSPTAFNNEVDKYLIRVYRNGKHKTNK